jgi:hypothetical protein
MGTAAQLRMGASRIPELSAIATILIDLDLT